jgi:hypothetical protein
MNFFIVEGRLHFPSMLGYKDAAVYFKKETSTEGTNDDLDHSIAG